MHHSIALIESDQTMLVSSAESPNSPRNDKKYDGDRFRRRYFCHFLAKIVRANTTINQQAK